MRAVVAAEIKGQRLLVRDTRRGTLGRKERKIATDRRQEKDMGEAGNRRLLGPGNNRVLVKMRRFLGDASNDDHGNVKREGSTRGQKERAFQRTARS
jgi:hypothetical protein